MTVLVSQSYHWKPCLVTESGCWFRLQILHYLESNLWDSLIESWEFLLYFFHITHLNALQFLLSFPIDCLHPSDS